MMAIECSQNDRDIATDTSNTSLRRGRPSHATVCCAVRSGALPERSLQYAKGPALHHPWASPLDSAAVQLFGQLSESHTSCQRLGEEDRPLLAPAPPSAAISLALSQGQTTAGKQSLATRRYYGMPNSTVLRDAKLSPWVPYDQVDEHVKMRPYTSRPTRICKVANIRLAAEYRHR